MNPRLAALQPYPFERIRALTADLPRQGPSPHIPLSLGEPKHPAPQFLIDALCEAIPLTRDLGLYPATRGSDELRHAISQWLEKRFAVSSDPHTQVLPVNGTREALFSFAQAVVDGNDAGRVLMPNPFYQIYEGAALLAGATPYMVDNLADADYQQDFEGIPAEVWRSTQLLYICSPGNPTGQVIPQATQQRLIELAHRYDFVIAADECYSEIYFDEPPPSLLSAAKNMGNHDFSRCVVFHSLSKRSNLPGLRSGFVAGDANILARYLTYRTYHGCAMSPSHQRVSALAWSDEAHVDENRRIYQDKFTAVTERLADHYQLNQPSGGFYHWIALPMDDQDFCAQLLQEQNITVTPGSYLGRDSGGGNAGQAHVRVAWVAPVNECLLAADRLIQFAARHF